MTTLRKHFFCLLLLIAFFLTKQTALAADTSVILGDMQTEKYLPMLTGKRR